MRFFQFINLRIILIGLISSVLLGVVVLVKFVNYLESVFNEPFSASQTLTDGTLLYLEGSRSTGFDGACSDEYRIYIQRPGGNREWLSESRSVSLKYVDIDMPLPANPARMIETQGQTFLLLGRTLYLRDPSPHYSFRANREKRFVPHWNRCSILQAHQILGEESG